jgi:hypothetical protein
MVLNCKQERASCGAAPETVAEVEDFAVDFARVRPEERAVNLTSRDDGLIGHHSPDRMLLLLLKKT